MLTILSLALFATTTAAIQDTKSSLDNYNKCLTDFTIMHLDQKTSSDTFKKAVAGTCVKERDAMMAQAKKDEMEFGSSAKEAAEFADGELEATLSKVTEDYAGHLKAGTKPVKP